MGVRATQNSAPILSAAEAGELLERHWGISGELTPVGSFEDLNYRVRRGDHDALLKVCERSAEEIAREHAVMAHLAGRELEVGVPAPLPTRDLQYSVPAGAARAHLLMWVPGLPLSEVPYLASSTVTALGRLAGLTTAALADLALEPDEESKWDPRLAVTVVRELLDATDLAQGAMAADLETAIAPLDALPPQVAAALPSQMIHGDISDYNALASPGARGELPVTGLIDFGDVTHTWRVCELACACVATASRAPADPLGAMRAVLAGFHGRNPLGEAEIEALWPLILGRAAACAALSAHHLGRDETAPYMVGMHQGDVEALRTLLALPGRLPTAVFRSLTGLHPAPDTLGLPARLRAAAPVALIAEPVSALDLGVASDDLEDGGWLDPGAEAMLAAAAGPVSATRWGEVTLTQAGHPGPHAAETLRLGITVHAPRGTPVRAPLSARVVQAAPGALRLRLPEPGIELRLDGVDPVLEAGAEVAAGATLGATASAPLHVQLITDPTQPRTGRVRDRTAWQALCPDPSPLLGAELAAPVSVDADAGRARRAAAVASAQGLYYDAPMAIVRGWRQYLYDAAGRPYLDMINNVAVVGHSHPRITEAARRQFRLLNTNSRFLYDAMARYAQRLADLLPDGLDQVFLVNSGSEACDLALQIIRVATGRQDIVALQGAYHGWTSGVFEACTSPADNPFWAETKPDFVHLASQPDPYRGLYGADAGGYIDSVGEACARAGSGGAGPAGFISEAMLGNQGALVPPAGFLPGAYARVREAGGLCIADEIQVGYGRTGETFWAFEHSGAQPDVVCIAKAAGNGHPIGAVVCRPELAQALGRRAAFFSSTGGGPVSCEIGLAVLDVIADEGLQANALAVGEHLRASLQAVMADHRLVGAVHGRGLYLGVDLVRDPVAKTPATQEAHAISERMRELGVIVQPTGDHGNVLKVKPPLCVTTDDADHFAESLDRALGELEVHLPHP
ncbi:MAG TPA: aminotransferase [Solirubrobacteraceae bacterium]|nr:aminotransferase [Solirubrobacteraceae bacterium]